MAEIFDEAAPVQELPSYAGLDAMRDGAFDDITELVARFFAVPVAIISVLHGGRVWFKSAYGLQQARKAGIDPDRFITPVLSGRVRATTGSGEPHAPAANDNGFQFYASVPLRGLNDQHFGSLCIIDTKSRMFSRDDEQMLERFGRIAMLQIEQRLASREIADLVQEHGLDDTLFNNTATHDVRTGLLNRGAIQSHLHALCEMGGDDPRVATLLFDVDHLRTVNDIYGQPGGDAVLMEVARRIQSAVRPRDHVGRLGGEKFMVLLVDCDRRSVARIAERVRTLVERVPFRYGDREIRITISAGVFLPAGKLDADEAMRAADAALCSAKREGRNRVVISRAHPDAVSANA